MSAIIFDFDGTIADTFGAVVEAFHELTGRREQLSPDEVSRLRGLPPRAIVKELGIPFWKVPFLIRRGRRLMGQRMHDIQPVAGLADLIQTLKQHDHQMFIISSNSRPNIEIFLQEHHMEDAFVEVVGSVGLFSKSVALRKLVQRNSLKIGQTYYVADEVRDIQAAERARVQCVAVGWGYNTISILQVHKPAFLIRKPAELLGIVTS